MTVCTLGVMFDSGVDVWYVGVTVCTLGVMCDSGVDV